MATDDDEEWLTLADVPQGSWLARQIQLMRDFLAHRLDPEDFRQLWYEAQLQKIAYEERPGARIREVTSDLHEAIGDYDPISTEHEPEWLDEDQLRDATRKALTRIENLRVD